MAKYFLTRFNPNLIKPTAAASLKHFRVNKLLHYTLYNAQRTFSSGTGSNIILESKYGTTIDVPDMTLPQYIWQSVEKWIDDPLATCGMSGRSYKYGQTRFACALFGSALLSKCGLKKGDVIGLMLPNLPEYIIAIHGAIEAGLIVTFVNPLYTADEVKRQFEDAEVVCCVTIPQFAPILEAIAPSLPKFKSGIILHPPEQKDESTHIKSSKYKVYDFKTLLLSQGTPEQLPDTSPTDIAVLPYSSGTTGLPKGVMLSHQNLVANIEQLRLPEINALMREPDSHHKDTALSILPFFHIFGFNGILNILLREGVHIVTLPKFHPELYINCLRTYKPTGLFVVPSLLMFLATHNQVKSEDLASVKEIVSGAAPATVSLIQKFREKFPYPDLIVRQGYGMTEMSPVSLCMALDAPRSKDGSAGQLVKGTQARIVDLSTGEDLPVMKTGELLIRGPQVMKGYWKNDRATAETIDSDGWIHTGDVAYYDEDGYFYIVDRTKDLIKVKGNQVSPTELENIIVELPGIADVAVAGIPDECSGEIPKAFVVKKPDSNITEEEIIRYVEPKVVGYKKLDGGVQFVNSIPRNQAGKILRKELVAAAS